jgi:hypothetical protein
MSISPGHTTLPVASIVSVAAGCLEPAAQPGDAAIGDEDVLDCVRPRWPGSSTRPLTMRRLMPPPCSR